MSIVEYYGDSSPQGIIKYWEKKTKWECAREVLRCWNKIEEMEINKLIPQDAEEFIAENAYIHAAKVETIGPETIRAWMTGHVRVPVEAWERQIELLQAAKCPNCGGSGQRIDGAGETCYCGFCLERSELLNASKGE